MHKAVAYLSILLIVIGLGLLWTGTLGRRQVNRPSTFFKGQALFTSNQRRVNVGAALIGCVVCIGFGVLGIVKYGYLL